MTRMSQPPSEQLPTLVLASGSPRRRELLARLGVVVQVRPVDLDESLRAAESARRYVRRLAREKAEARGEPGELVLAADTVVVLGESILGKPADPEDARRMLRHLAGHEHTVLTGVALWDPRQRRRALGVETTGVRMAPMREEEIDWYVATGEPADKAGAYAVQGLGALFVEAVDGNHSNVVGLPIPLTYRLFTELGYDLKAWARVNPRT